MRAFLRRHLQVSWLFDLRETVVRNNAGGYSGRYWRSSPRHLRQAVSFERPYILMHPFLTRCRNEGTFFDALPTCLRQTRRHIRVKLARSEIAETFGSRDR